MIYTIASGPDKGLDVWFDPAEWSSNPKKVNGFCVYHKEQDPAICNVYDVKRKSRTMEYSYSFTIAQDEFLKWELKSGLNKDHNAEQLRLKETA